MQSSYLKQAVRAYREEATQFISGGNYDEALKCIELASHLDDLISDYFDESPVREIYPDSSVIHFAGYDEETEELRIEFSDSSYMYKYLHVPNNIWEEFLKAPSKGQFFNQVIKGQYNWIYS